jgi:SAM-dependent methyltransferase
MSLATIPEDHDAIQNALTRIFPEIALASHGREHALLAQRALISRISEEERRSLVACCNEMKLAPVPLNLIKVGTHHFAHIREKFGTSEHNPPDHIHRMQKEDSLYVGDIYSANMILSSLRENGLGFGDGGDYLDFGCSSGSLIRILKAVQPRAHFSGVDPIASSILWAQTGIPGANFHVSDVEPPLPFAPGSFDGVTAVSIWSHLGEQEALRWFSEMHRCIRPGGWLCFTTHGIVSLSYYNQRKMLRPPRLKALFEGLLNSDFVFEEVYIGESPEGLSATGYGNTYFRRDWLISHLADQWRLMSFEPGLNQNNQDIYVLERRR